MRLLHEPQSFLGKKDMHSDCYRPGNPVEHDKRQAPLSWVWGRRIDPTQVRNLSPNTMVRNFVLHIDMDNASLDLPWNRNLHLNIWNSRTNRNKNIWLSCLLGANDVYSASCDKGHSGHLVIEELGSYQPAPRLQNIDIMLGKQPTCLVGK